MRTLAIDCATQMCSVALFEDDRTIAAEGAMLGRGHAEALVPMIAALPGRGQARRIAVALGPGSFTGVRVGLAAARALALAWGSELIGYPTLTLLAAIAREQHGAQPVSVATTGGHGQWFVQDFAAEGTPLADLASLAPDQAAGRAACALVAGSEAEALVALRGWGGAAPLWPEARAFTALPPAAWLADPRPLYGRAPDARLPAAR